MDRRPNYRSISLGEQLKTNNEYYNQSYHKNRFEWDRFSDFIKIAKLLGIKRGDKVLDVGCGEGDFIRSATHIGATCIGVDVSEKAIDFCRKNIPSEFLCSTGETLQFEDSTFDIVTSLGVVEHIENKHSAIREMARVSSGKVVICVPVSEFIFDRIGIFKGTKQVDHREDIYSIDKWVSIFNECGLGVDGILPDNQLLSRYWIYKNGILAAPIRFLIGLLVFLLPIRYQYLLYFICSKRG